jgi:anti-sigma regulatory factor (Ser/Thr protein kinase)
MVSTVLSSVPFASTASTTPPSAGARAWHLPARVVIPGALLVAALMSTRFLAQPFVWRHWPLDEVLLGWRDIFVGHAVTALAIGVALMVAGRLSVRGLGLRAALMAAAIVAGAALGELLPQAFDPRAGWFDVQGALGRMLQAVVVACSVAAMVALWRRSAAARSALDAAELRRTQVEQQLVQQRLQALRSRIEPHFLFNTLLEHFVAYLHWTLASANVQHIRLGQEVDLVHAYLSVVATRMSGRLALHWDVPDALRECLVPPLVVATLAENAVKHGVASQPEGGTIAVQARALGTMLEITVVDTGVGLSGSGGSGMGLANIRARLATLDGDAASLGLEHNPPHGVLARLRLPLRSAP